MAVFASDEFDLRNANSTKFVPHLLLFFSLPGFCMNCGAWRRLVPWRLRAVEISSNDDCAAVERIYILCVAV